MNSNSWMLNLGSPIRLKLFEFLNKIKPGTLFLFHNDDNTYSLMVRTNKRVYYPDTDMYSWKEKIQMTIDNIECFYENSFGLDSSKCFDDIDDSELNNSVAFLNKKASELDVFDFANALKMI